ncbi:MAG: phosphodiester glycosidase family protein, partial [Myxococcales bacterium]|nr:phosphodiester glycosidase family protein [Myxococcales bacterium]
MPIGTRRSAPPEGYAVAADDAAPDDAAVALNLGRIIEARFGLKPRGPLRVFAADDGPIGYGQPIIAWFDAPLGRAGDVFSVRARLGPRAVPTAVAAPVNLTRTPDGDERILAADRARVLYADAGAAGIEGVALLDFRADWLPAQSPLATRAVAAFAAWQAYGTWRGPERRDLVLRQSAGELTGALDAAGFSVVADGLPIAVDLGAGQVVPAAAARLLARAEVERDALSLAADALRQSSIVGVDRVIAIEQIWFEVGDWWRVHRHRAFPTAADRLPVMRVVDPPEGPPGWPPPRIALGGADQGLPGEGRWSAIESLADQLDPPALHAFIRVDPDRPFERTHLFAFDLRRLGLHFTAGTRHPQSTTGARGTGRIPASARPALVAAFNGGFKAEHGRFGAIEEGRVLVRPARGLATVALTGDGRAAFGLWDADTLTAPFVSLRQNLAPLIEDGLINPRRVRQWGQLVAALDADRTPRSALGVTVDGTLIYAWSAAISAERLGEAMARAGVRFAIHLDMNPGHTGLALYRPEGEAIEALKGAPEMDLDPRRWLQTDARDFFYLTFAERLPERLSPEAGGPAWTPIQWADGVAVAARAWMTPTEGAGSVRLTLLDTERLVPALVPGLAETRPTTGVPPDDLALPGPPVLWSAIGLRAPESTAGFIADGQMWRVPEVGVMTFAVDPRGDTHLGRFGEGDLPAEAAWRSLCQGPALVVGGQPGDAAQGRTGLPAAGMGVREDGRLVFAASADGDRA